MAVIMQAPADFIQTSIVLPSPKIGDNYTPQKSVNMVVMNDGKKWTYIKNAPGTKLQYTFELTYMKRIELEYFIRSYRGCKFQIIDHHDEIFNCILVSNPIEFKTIRKGEQADCPEISTVTLEFQAYA